MIQEHDYNSSCFMCRKLAGRKPAGVHKTSLCFSHTKDEIDQLRARNAELEAEVDRLNAHAVEVYKENRKEYLVQQAEVERLRNALTHLADRAFLADTEGDLKIMSNFQSGGLFIADHVAKIAKKALEARDG